jgi:hypothetical protein
LGWALVLRELEDDGGLDGNDLGGVMILSNAVLEFLKAIPDEEDRKVLTVQFEKYELFRKAIDLSEEWKHWADENVPRHQLLLRELNRTGVGRKLLREIPVGVKECDRRNIT